MGVYVAIIQRPPLPAAEKGKNEPKGCGCGTIIALLGMIALIIIVVVTIIS